MVFHWSLSVSKSPQVSTTLFCILADLNHGVLWMISTRLIISKSTSPFTNPLVTVPRAPIAIGTTVTFMFHCCCFSSSLSRSRYLFFFLLSFSFQLRSAGTAKSTILLGLVFWPRLDDSFVSQNPRGVCACHSPGQILCCIYHLIVWSNFNFLHNSQWIILL